MAMTGWTFPVISASAPASGNSNNTQYISDTETAAAGTSEPEPKQKFKLDDYEDISAMWTAEFSDYTLISRCTADAASNWRSEEYCDNLRRNKQKQEFEMSNLMRPAFFYGDQPVSFKQIQSRQTMGLVHTTPKAARPQRMFALDYIMITGTEAIFKGNKDLVFGPVHPKQRNPEILKLPRKSGFSNADLTFEDFLATQPLSYLPPLPEYHY